MVTNTATDPLCGMACVTNGVGVSCPVGVIGGVGVSCPVGVIGGVGVSCLVGVIVDMSIDVLVGTMTMAGGFPRDVSLGLRKRRPFNNPTRSIA